MNRVSVAVCAAATLAAGCSAGADRGEGSERSSPLQRASEGLCRAQVLASEDDVPGAAAVFQAETHDYLHELAAILRGREPAAAGALLETKQRVEAVLRVPRRADPSEVVQLLLALQRAFIDGAEAAGLPRPLCRTGAV
jgi:hypothetical protein